MLPPGNRLRRRPEFSAAVRHGRRAGRGTVVVHLIAPGDAAGAGTSPADGTPATATPPRVGLVVGRAVGPAVIRNQVKRRLRHILAARLDALPPGAHVVVRAAPSAAGASSAALSEDVDAALARLRRQNAGRQGGGARGGGRPAPPAGGRGAR